MTEKMLNYKTNQYFDNLPYHNVIKYDMGSEREVKRAYKDGYHECEKTLIESIKTIRKLLHALKNERSDYTFALENTHPVLREAEKFLKENENDTKTFENNF